MQNDGDRLNIPKIDDFNFSNKTVLVRVDLNTSYNESTNKIEDSARFREHSKTIKELSEKGAKVVVLAHQGRRGNPDFVHLDQHAILLKKYVGKEVNFVDDTIGAKAVNKIKSLKNGDILLIDNIRFLEEEVENKTPEEHSKGKLVQTLAPLVDYFVNDAFSVAHRSHASLVGFTPVLTSLAGRVMIKEWRAIRKLESETCSLPPLVYVLGGNKPDDCLRIIEFMFYKKKEPIITVLTCGVLGELFLLAKGYDLGMPTINHIKKNDYLQLIYRLRTLLQKFPNHIHMPCDVAFFKQGRKEIPIDSLPAEDLILDIGKKTVDKYSKILKEANCVVAKGTPGAYEKEGFELGTEKILELISSLDAFTLVGGGDTNQAIRKFGIEKNKFSYLSIAGGAFITALSGEKLPAIEALKKYCKSNEPN